MLHLRTRSAALAVALGLLTGIESRAQQAAPAPQLADLIPSTSVALVSAPDLVAACRALEATDMGKMCGQFGPFVNGIKHGLQEQIAQAEQQFEQGSGFKVDDLLAALGGGVEVAVSDPDAPRGSGVPSAAALIHTAGRESAVRAILAHLKSQGPPADPSGPKPYTHGQVAVDAFLLPNGLPVFTAFTRDVLLVSAYAELENSMLDVAAGQAPQGFAPLSSAPDYTAVRGRTVGGGLPVAFAYVNAGLLIKHGAGGNPEDMKMLTKLGIADLRGVGLGLSVEGGKAILSGHLAAPSSGPRQGLFPIFAQGPVDAAQLASLAPGDPVAFFAVHFDLGQAMDAALALADTMDPEKGKQARAQIADVSKHLGFDIRKDLLGSLGGDWAAVSFEPPAGGLAESVMIVNVPNEQGLGKAVRQLAEAFKLEQRQIAYQGKEILYLLGPVSNPHSSFSRNPLAQMGGFGGLAISISGGHALVSTLPQQIEDYLDRMSVPTTSGAPMTALSADPAFTRALAAAPKGTSFFIWDNAGRSVTAMWNSALQIGAAFQGLARGNGVPVDVSLLPRGADLAPFTAPGASYVVVDDAGIAMRSQLSLGVSGGVMIGGATVAVVAAIEIAYRVESSQDANEAAALGTLRELNTCQALYREGDKDQNGVLDYAPDLESLHRCGNLISPTLATGRQHGYRFAILHADQFTWSATAMPIEPHRTGDRSFFVDESGVIRYSYGGEPANAGSPAVGSPSSEIRATPRASSTPAASSGNERQWKTLFAGAVADPNNVIPYLKHVGLLDANSAPADPEAYRRWMEGYQQYVQKNAQQLGTELGDKAKAKEFYDKNQ